MAHNVYLETFGCQMNELDSELVTSAMRNMGYRFVSDPAKAQVVLYNTCSVREHAEQKVWSRLGELALRKAREPELVVGVMGCMAEREGEKLLKRMPVVDVLVGPGELDKLPGLVDNAIRTRLSLLGERETRDLLATPENERPNLSLLLSAGQVALAGGTSRRSATLAAAQDTLELLDLSRAISPEDLAAKGGAGRAAYVRITRGCNKFCTYCVVPFTRGAEIHRPPQAIVDECKKLADAGVIEITLLGQTVNHYRFEAGAAVSVGGVVQPQKGRAYGITNDPSGDPHQGEGVTTFADLLHLIHEKVPAIQRLRFVTSFPRSFGNDILEVMRDSPRICRYLHVPAQSGSDRMLKLMNRQYTVTEYLEFLDRARGILHQPEIGRPLTLAGDIIVGFPTETEEDFEATKVLMRRAAYKNCYIFKYSPRPGTIAIDKFEDDVPDAVKRRRNAELLDLQDEIGIKVMAEFAGLTTDVFVTGVSKRQGRLTKARIAGEQGRSHAHAHPPAHSHENSNGVEAQSKELAGVSLTIGGKKLGGTAASDADDDRGCAIDATSTIVGVEQEEENAAAGVGAGGNSPTASGPIQMSSRTDGDVIAFFDVPPGVSPDELIGTIVKFKVTRCEPLALHGEMVESQMVKL